MRKSVMWILEGHAILHHPSYSACRSRVLLLSEISPRRLFRVQITTQTQSICEQRERWQSVITHTTKNPPENEIKCCMTTMSTSSNIEAIKDYMNDDQYQYNQSLEKLPLTFTNTINERDGWSRWRLQSCFYMHAFGVGIVDDGNNESRDWLNW